MSARGRIGIVALVVGIGVITFWSRTERTDIAAIESRLETETVADLSLGWQPMRLVVGVARGPAFPQPMFTESQRECIGFTRPPVVLDSVVRGTCPRGSATVDETSYAVVRDNVLGDSRWIVLAFGVEIRSIEQLDSDADNATSVYLGAATAAILLPADQPLGRIRWQADDGRWFRSET